MAETKPKIKEKKKGRRRDVNPVGASQGGLKVVWRLLMCLFIVESATLCHKRLPKVLKRKESCCKFSRRKEVRGSSFKRGRMRADCRRGSGAQSLNAEGKVHLSSLSFSGGAFVWILNAERRRGKCAFMRSCCLNWKIWLLQYVHIFE